MKNVQSSTSMLPKVVLAAILHATAALSYAQAVNTQNEKCEDSTCVIRQLKLTSFEANASSAHVSSIRVADGGSGPVANPTPSPTPGPTCVAGEISRTPLACASGYTGTLYSIVTASCPYGQNGSQVMSTATDSSGCAAIATPNPTVPDTPSPTGCETIFGWVAIGTNVSDPCTLPDYGGGTHPRGQRFQCTAGGWRQTNAGNEMYQDYCN